MSGQASWQDRLIDDNGGLREILQTEHRIAVLGIKDERRSWEPAHFVARYMQEVGYAVVGVNPSIDEALGQPVLDSLAEVEGPIDIVNVFRHSDNIPAHVDEVLALPERPKVFWMQLGIRHQEAARRLAEAGIQVVQDRCILVEHRRLIMRGG
ncbi:MAG: CoA-binding protein [Caldilineae bacterium]|nr:CoA-binding protein [Chloroflexota bacterium]MCB9176901.1 CoA-binding protein [Caldilineae bacterium]